MRRSKAGTRKPGRPGRPAGNEILLHPRDAALLWPILRNAPDLIVVIDRKGRILFINRVLPGFRAEDIIGRTTVWEFVPARYHPRMRAAFDRAFHGKPAAYEVPAPTDYRKPGWWSTRVAPVMREGRVTEVLLLCTDATRRKASERERKRLLAEAVGSRKAAEGASRAKDAFFAILSHELRTPLTAVMGWFSLLRSGAVPAAQTGQTYDVIERNLRMQAQIIEDLLDFSYFATGRLAVEPAPLDLRGVVRSALEIVRPAAGARRIALSLSAMPMEPVTVMGEAGRLRQVFWNLLANAVKYTPEGGQVEAGVDLVEGRAEAWVRDTGEGIRKDFLPLLFEPFLQDEEPVTRRHGGLGLGLAIVRHLVAVHGGEITAESAGEGKGACFRVRLPLAYRTPAAASSSTALTKPSMPSATTETRSASI